MGTRSSIALTRSLVIERHSSARRRRPIRGWHPGAPDERGQAMVEFAIIVPVLLLIIVGILYFGRFLSYINDETHLANIAARYAAVNEDPYCGTTVTPNNCSTGTLANYVKSQATPGEFTSGSSDVPQAVKVCISIPTGSAGTQGTPVQATVSAQFKVVPFLNKTITVNETATMMLEQTPDSSVVGCST